TRKKLNALYNCTKPIVIVPPTPCPLVDVNGVAQHVCRDGLNIKPDADLNFKVGGYASVTFWVVRTSSQSSGVVEDYEIGVHDSVPGMNWANQTCSSNFSGGQGGTCSNNRSIVLQGNPTEAGVYEVTIYAKEKNCLSNVCREGKNTFKVVVQDNQSGAPVISGVSGPTTLKVGEVGTWKINASSNYNDYLSYSVVWGDEVSKMGSASENGVPAYARTQQSATFTHQYSQAGTYSPAFYVTNQKNQMAEASISVQVGGGVISSKPDIIVAGVACDPVNPKTNEWIFCSVTVANNSSVNITKSFDVNIQGIAVTVNAPLNAWEKKTVKPSSGFGFSAAGSHELNFPVDIWGSVDESNEDNNTFTMTINVGNVNPSITVLSPNGGEAYQAGQVTQMPIKWKADCNYSSFRIGLSGAGVYRDVVDIASGICSSGQVGIPYYTTWMIPGNLPSASDYKLQVIGLRNNVVVDEYDYSDAPFTISSVTAQPNITGISPTQGTSNTTVTIYGTNLSGTTNVEFYNLNGQLSGTLTPSSVSATSVVFTISSVFAANASPGGYNIGVVTNNCPGGCNSNRLGFTLNAPVSASGTLYIDPQSVSVGVNGSARVKALYMPACPSGFACTQSLTEVNATWTVANTSVAGLVQAVTDCMSGYNTCLGYTSVTGIAPGTTQLKAIYRESNGNTLTATAPITVANTNTACALKAQVVSTNFGENNTTWGFDVAVNATNPPSTSNGWTTDFQGYVPSVTAYGVTKHYGNFFISYGPLQFTPRDQVNSGCTTSITVLPPVSPSSPITITTTSPLPKAVVGSDYYTSIEGSGVASGLGSSWSLSSGSLPPGIGFSTCSTNTCTGLKGTPTTAGTYVFTLTLSASGLSPVSKQFTLTVVSGGMLLKSDSQAQMASTLDTMRAMLEEMLRKLTR
ncbi:MAG TPA: IPT/TIG domain-containing protein, partial [Candidatus Paceibacterota bacterium]